MSREIKFRGKQIDNGEWVYGDLIHSRTKVEAVIIDQEGMGKKVDPESVGQYTGLKDRNSNEIYEGDIIDAENEGFPFTKNWKGIVKMIDDSWLIENFEGTDGEYLFEEIRADEVIGNIYENKELITHDKDN